MKGWKERRLCLFMNGVLSLIAFQTYHERGNLIDVLHQHLANRFSRNGKNEKTKLGDGDAGEKNQAFFRTIVIEVQSNIARGTERANRIAFSALFARDSLVFYTAHLDRLQQRNRQYELLDSGYKTVSLYTGLDNPTSNKFLYGNRHEPVMDSMLLQFVKEEAT
ncbi:hypothetical protein PthstB1num2_11000 [Parageobacillus thermoglucosidasius]|nr:hypothetical protein PthstB1num2_11000 [Parageobacillus thermoglucosidasius]